MIDTAAKRCSAIATRRLPWFRRFLLPLDGTMTQADRQQLAFVYRGIVAAAPVVTTVFRTVYLTGRIDNVVRVTGRSDRDIHLTGRDDRVEHTAGD